jgi:hypothetical protein
MTPEREDTLDAAVPKPLSSGAWIALAVLLVAMALGWRYLVLPIVVPAQAPPSTITSPERRVADRPQPKTEVVQRSERPASSEKRADAHVMARLPRTGDATARPRRNLPPVAVESRSPRGTLTYRDDDPPQSIDVDGTSDDAWVRGRRVDGETMEPYASERTRAGSRARGPWRVAMCVYGNHVAPCLVPRQSASASPRRRAALSWRRSPGALEEADSGSDD